LETGLQQLLLLLISYYYYYYYYQQVPCSRLKTPWAEEAFKSIAHPPIVVATLLLRILASENLDTGSAASPRDLKRVSSRGASFAELTTRRK